MKTSELVGDALNRAVHTALQYEDIHEGCTAPPYSTDWAFGGPIIEREKIRLDTSWNQEDGQWSARIDSVGGWWQGDTPLIAAMRCYVTSKLGDEVEIPKELT